MCCNSRLNINEYHIYSVWVGLKKTLLIKEDDSLQIWGIIIVVAFPQIFGHC